MSDRLTGPERGADLAPLLESGWQLVEGRDAMGYQHFEMIVASDGTDD